VTDKRILKDLKANGHGLIQELSQALPGRPDETQRISVTIKELRLRFKMNTSQYDWRLSLSHYLSPSLLFCYTSGSPHTLHSED
jgi:hypothetical protein